MARCAACGGTGYPPDMACPYCPTNIGIPKGGTPMPRFTMSRDGVERTTIRVVFRVTRDEYERLRKHAWAVGLGGRRRRNPVRELLSHQYWEVLERAREDELDEEEADGKGSR